MNVGILGGTFDPFHCGHLDPILAVRDTMRWDRVIYVPAHVQPFKTDRITASGYHRYAMTVLGIEGHEELYVSSLELERGEVSYTVDTLQHLRSEYPDATLDWIIGDDNLAKLLEWKSIDTIFELANFAVLTRGAADSQSASGRGDVLRESESGLRARRSTPNKRPPHGAITFAENATVPVSSTEVRRRLRAGESIDGLVPPRVWRYIQHYDLYRKGHS